MWKALMVIVALGIVTPVSTATSGLDRKTELCLRLAEVYYEGPIFITSGYRDKEKNREVGGVPNSQHLWGNAVDIRMPQNASLLNKLIWALSVAGFTGIGIYDDHVHADTRQNPVFWRSK